MTPQTTQPAATQTWAVANQKGGVGKTTTAINLALALLANGYTPLIIDADPQGSATKALGIMPKDGRTLSQVLGGASQPTATLRSAAVLSDAGVEIVPATLSLADTEAALMLKGMTALDARHLKALAQAIRGEGHRWTHILVDCPPNPGILTVNALMAADLVIVPTQPEELSIDGVRQIKAIIGDVAGVRRRALPMAAIVTQADMTLVQHQRGYEALDLAYDLYGAIPMRKGADRERQLLHAYGQVLPALLDTMQKMEAASC